MSSGNELIDALNTLFTGHGSCHDFCSIYDPGSLADSIRKKEDIHFGLYHSLFEWYHPLFLQDKNNSWKTNDFVQVYRQICRF